MQCTIYRPPTHRMYGDIDPHVHPITRYFTCIFAIILHAILLELVNSKPRDPLGSNNRRTLYDTIFYKPEDDPMGSKHVALLIP